MSDVDLGFTLSGVAGVSVGISVVLFVLLRLDGLSRRVPMKDGSVRAEIGFFACVLTSALATFGVLVLDGETGRRGMQIGVFVVQLIAAGVALAALAALRRTR